MQFFRNEKNTPFTQIIFLHIAILELKILQFAGERDNDLKLTIYTADFFPYSEFNQYKSFNDLGESKNRFYFFILYQHI